MFDTPAMVYAPDDTYLAFVWKGGYVDVYGADEDGTPHGSPHDVINVYGRTEQLTLQTFQQVCDDYLAEEGEDEE